jgi:hypothetical protein
MKRAAYFLALAFCFGVFTASVSAQTTYTWNQTGTAAWTTSTNWTPTRTTPAANDVLVFNNGATTTPTALPSQTIGQLSVSGNTIVNLQAAAAGTLLTITGGTGTDLSVASGSQLNSNVATNTLAITVGAGATGSISGSMTYTLAAHSLIAVDASGITFNSGASFTQGTGNTGNVFGSGTSNSVVFASGSTFNQLAGSNPFQKAQPASVVVFQTGSLFSLQANITPSFSGRTYSNFELNSAGANISVTGGAAVVMDNLTITAGTLNFGMTGTPGHAIKGNIAVAGTLVFNPATPGTLNLNGTSAQTISGAGTITLNDPDQTININNANGVTLSRNLTLTQGILNLGTGVLTTGANTLTIGSAGSITGASPTTFVNGNLNKTFAGIGVKGFEVGTANGYSPVSVNITAGTFPTDFSVRAVQGPQPNIMTTAGALQRYWKLAGNGVTVNLLFNYLDTDVPAPASTENTFVIFKWDGGFTTPGGSVNTATNEASISGVSDATLLSDWTLAQPNAPTAANGLVSGYILNNAGTPVEGAVVNLSGEQNRKTITNAKGYYQFDNVETNGFYTVTPSRANYSFGPKSRAFSLLGNHTEAGFTGSSTGDNANPLDTAEYFVRQQYVDILGREPDEGGFNYWSNEILSCGGDASCTDRRRREVAASFFIAEEFQDTGSFIYDVYKGTLGRKPVFNEYSADRKQVVGGSTLTAQKAAFANNFVQRTEFVQKYQGQTTADTFVDALLQNVQQSSQLDLGSQRAGLISQYNSGGTLEQSRSRVLQSLADNGALKQKEYNAAFVLTEYFGYLRRNPEPEGYDFWLNVVTNGDVGNYRGMVCSFITSTEYQQRFSSVVSHSNAECGQ